MNPKLIKYAEWIVAILLSATVLFVFFVRTTHAGGLWRDECDSLEVARLPTFADVLHNLKFTSFPVLFPTTVRIFTNLFGTSDASLRCFGFLVGVALLAVAWFNARSSCAPPPAQSTDCRSVSNSIPGALRCNRNQHALLSFLSVKNSALIFCIGRGLTETVLCSPNSKSSFHKRSKK